MKKLMLTVILCLSIFTALSQTIVRMELENGVYKVPCTVNGVKMKFVFDTGASNISISMSMAEFLLDGDYLSEKDVIGTGQSVVADGRIVDHVKIILKDIEIGGVHMHDVEAIVVDNQDSPLLLGQSAIQKLGPVTIDGDKLIILEAIGSEESLDERCSNWYDLACENFFNDDYEKTIEYICKIKDNGGLMTEFCYYMLSDSYYSMDLYSDCIRIGKEALRKIKSFDDKEIFYWIQLNMANSYRFGFEKYYEAIAWYEKCLSLMMDTESVCSKSEAESFYHRSELLYSSLAICYGYNKDLGNEYEMFKQAMLYRLLYLGKEVDQIPKRQVLDDTVGEYLYTMGLICYLRYDEGNGNAHMIASAMCGYWEAIDECRRKGLRY